MPVVDRQIAENRVILDRVTWETFNRLLIELGENRSSRLAYDGGILEIMTPLAEHEHNNRFIEKLIGAITDELNLNVKNLGSLTLKKDNIKKGIEPDSCYYLANEPQVRSKQSIDLNVDPVPDLVLEIDITSGSMDKLPIYAALGVPEIWRYDGENLQVFLLDKSIPIYNVSNQSYSFPWLELDLIPQLLQQCLIDGETATLKVFRSWIRKRNIK